MFGCTRVCDVYGSWGLQLLCPLAYCVLCVALLHIMCVLCVHEPPSSIAFRVEWQVRNVNGHYEKVRMCSLGINSPSFVAFSVPQPSRVGCQIQQRTWLSQQIVVTIYTLICRTWVFSHCLPKLSSLCEHPLPSASQSYTGHAFMRTCGVVSALLYPWQQCSPGTVSMATVVSLVAGSYLSVRQWDYWECLLPIIGTVTDVK